jgi:hypothetical protein
LCVTFPVLQMLEEGYEVSVNFSAGSPSVEDKYVLRLASMSFTCLSSCRYSSGFTGSPISHWVGFCSAPR